MCVYVQNRDLLGANSRARDAALVSASRLAGIAAHAARATGDGAARDGGLDQTAVEQEASLRTRLAEVWRRIHEVLSSYLKLGQLAGALCC